MNRKEKKKKQMQEEPLDSWRFKILASLNRIPKFMEYVICSKLL